MPETVYLVTVKSDLGFDSAVYSTVEPADAHVIAAEQVETVEWAVCEPMPVLDHFDANA